MEVTLDQAIDNLEKILAHILIERDLKLKGIQLGQAWLQLKSIKEAYIKFNYFDRRPYRKRTELLELKLKQYEDSYISSLELQLAIEDVQKLNDIIEEYKMQIIDKKKSELKDKMQFIKSELQRIITKNHARNTLEWQNILKDAQQIITRIDSVLSGSEQQFQNNCVLMSCMLKTVIQTKRIKDEEEEELLQIVAKLEELRNLQKDLNLQAYEDDSKLSKIEENQSKQGSQILQAEADYMKANSFVKQRRRTKVKLFFQGLFTAIGAVGGKIGMAIGLTFGTILGRKVAKTAINDNL